MIRKIIGIIGLLSTLFFGQGLFRIITNSTFREGVIEKMALQVGREILLKEIIIIISIIVLLSLFMTYFGFKRRR